MKVYYDSKHNDCAVEFDRDDTIYMSTVEGKMFIHSCKGGKPKIIEKQLLFEMDETDFEMDETEKKINEDFS